MDDNEEKIRVVTLLTVDEKEERQLLAWKSGRSLSGYLRYLVNKDIDLNSD